MKTVWAIVFIVWGNGAVTPDSYSINPAPLPVFASPALCAQGLDAYRAGMSKALALSTRPNPAGLSALQCRAASWVNGGWQYAR